MIPMTTDEERRIDALVSALGRVRQGPCSDVEKAELVYDFVQEWGAIAASGLNYRRPEPVQELRAAIRTLRAALLRHVEYFGGGSHHRDDCPAPTTCAECATNFMVEAALSSDTIAEKP